MADQKLMYNNNGAKGSRAEPDEQWRKVVCESERVCDGTEQQRAKTFHRCATCFSLFAWEMETRVPVLPAPDAVTLITMPPSPPAQQVSHTTLKNKTQNITRMIHHHAHSFSYLLLVQSLSLAHSLREWRHATASFWWDGGEGRGCLLNF